MATPKPEDTKKTKRPTALKRDLQSSKRRASNKIYKSRVKTAIRAYQESLEKSDANVTKAALNEVYSLLDKCAKKGVYKVNKANRTKSRLAAKAVAKV